MSCPPAPSASDRKERVHPLLAHTRRHGHRRDRGLGRHHGRCDPARLSEGTICPSVFADAQALRFLKRRFPDEPLLDSFDLEFVRSYARPALNAQWGHVLDSCGLHPGDFEYDEELFTDPYFPKTYKPIPFTQVNLEDPDAEPEIVWLTPGVDFH